MKARMLSLLTAVALFTGVGLANAAEPVALTATQLDSVTAGSAFANAFAGARAAGGVFASTYTRTDAVAISNFPFLGRRATSASSSAASAL